MARFWSGRTRPKVVYVAIASASASGSSGSSRASIVSPYRPNDPATAPTDTALSPEMTLTETFWESKYSRVSRASGRTRCSSTTSATGVTRPGASSASTGCSAEPSSSTRRPFDPISSARAATGDAGSRRTSGAPITQLPCSAKVAPLHLVADLNGATAVAVQSGTEGEVGEAG